MGYWSDVQIAMGERENEAHLAPKLGITYTELCQLDYTIETDESDEGLLYNYRIVFNQNNPKSILEKIKGLDKNLNVYLDPWEFNDEFDYDFEFEAITENNDYTKNFYDEIANLESLLTLDVPTTELKNILYRQIFISIIGTLETYLSSAFINRTFDSEDNLKRFICSHPEFKNQKFEIREIFDKYDEIETIAQKVMLDTIYHNLPIVRNMYKDTFNITSRILRYDYLFKIHPRATVGIDLPNWFWPTAGQAQQPEHHLYGKSGTKRRLGNFLLAGQLCHD